MKKLDLPQTIDDHRRIIEKNKLLNSVYRAFYKTLNKYSNKKPIVEIGSGGGFTKKIISNVITTDIVPADGVERIENAEKLSFKDSSIGTFIMLNTFHHIKNPEKALREMERCLLSGGEIKMIEPYNSFWGRFIFQNFHHETFNPKSGWKIEGKGRLSSANGAIPWIIFVRDKKIFKKKFPNLKIEKIEPHTPIRYLISGGLSMPQLLPALFYPLLVLLEEILSPLNSSLGMFATIKLKKTKN